MFLAQRPSSDSDNYNVQPTEEGTTLRAWLNDLHAHRRGELAELRRLSNAADAVFCNGFHQLIRTLNANYRTAQRLAPVVIAIAEIQNDAVSTSLPRQLAVSPGDSDRPRFSTLRMRRLLEIEDLSPNIDMFRRAIRQLDRTANVLDLAFSLYHWNASTRRAWAYEYFSIVRTD